MCVEYSINLDYKLNILTEFSQWGKNLIKFILNFIFKSIIEGFFKIDFIPLDKYSNSFKLNCIYYYQFKLFKVFNLIIILIIFINWFEYLLYLGLKTPIVIKYFLNYIFSSPAYILVNNRLELYLYSAYKVYNYKLSFSFITTEGL